MEKFVPNNIEGAGTPKEGTLLFSSTYRQSMSKREIVIPAKWRLKKSPLTLGDKPLLLLLAMNSRVLALPEYGIAEFEIPELCKKDGSQFSKSLEQTILGEQIYPTEPEFILPDINPRIEAGCKVAMEEWNRFSKKRNSSGKDFEQVIRTVLQSYGVSLQANVRVQGAEIDILLLQLTEEGRLSFSIVECKHYARSQRKVEARHVLRLFGLQEVIKKRLPIEGSMIVTTTPLTRDAELNYTVSRLLTLPPPEFRQFCEWVEHHRLKLNERRAPLFHIGCVSTRGRLIVPRAFATCLQGSSDVVLAGMLDRFEI